MHATYVLEGCLSKHRTHLYSFLKNRGEKSVFLFVLPCGRPSALALQKGGEDVNLVQRKKVCPVGKSCEKFIKNIGDSLVCTLQRSTNSNQHAVVSWGRSIRGNGETEPRYVNMHQASALTSFFPLVFAA